MVVVSREIHFLPLPSVQPHITQSTANLILLLFPLPANHGRTLWSCDPPQTFGSRFITYS